MIHLKIDKHKIDCYCSISHLQEMIDVLTNYAYWRNSILLTKQGKTYSKILNLYLNKTTDEDKIHLENGEYIIHISEDNFGLLEYYANRLDKNIDLHSYELNDLFYKEKNKYVSLYLYIVA